MFTKKDTETYRKKSLIALLIKMAESDGMNEREIRFIHDVARQMALSEDEVNEVRENISHYKLVPPKNEQDRMTILYHLLFLMKMDGKVSESEEQLCQSIGFRLGFNPNLTEDMINSVRHHIRERIPVDEMLNNIRKYLN